MKKKLLIAAIAITALASCSNDDFVGDQSLQDSSGTEGAILFTSNAPKITRAAGTDGDASNLGYSFEVYATKTVNSTTSNVFAHNVIGTPDASGNHTPYWVWYNTLTANTTTSNTSNWEYVGAAGSKTIPSGSFTLPAVQTIKYWDYSASQYDFVAYKATVETGEGDAKRPKITNYTTNGFTVQAAPSQLAGLYVADKITVTQANNSPSKPGTLPAAETKIGDIVQFTFRTAATKVRLGIYETIPGYVVRNVNFRPNTTGEGAEFTATTDNAKLSGSFNGTSSSTEATYNVTYNSTTGIAVFNATASASNYFDFGTFASATPTALGETSTTPMWASGSAAYQNVLPNTDHVGNMILKVDYQLYNSISGETINVKGAKAVVPSNYMTWKPNYAYTYLFKISDNTNGTTGTEGSSPEGLFPITFDAVTIAATDGSEVGTITTVSTPTITTYQQGSVYDNISEHGITYANANGAIYITVNTNTDGTLASLTAENTKLYTVDAGTTEADLILTTKTKTASGLLSILAADEEKQGITFTSGKAAKFTPAAGTTYAIEYLVSNAVTAVYTAVENGTTLTSGNTYYTSNAGAGEFVSNGEEVANGTNYFTLTTPAAPAVYQYKIIIVEPAS